MSEKEMRYSIEQLLLDLEFEYRGQFGCICPFSRENIAVKFGEYEDTFTSVDALMNATFIDGEPLKDICEKLTF